MTIQVKDLPEGLNDTVATRLRFARDAIKLPRNQVTMATGIPVKSIEKFENGSMEPSVSRLVALCELYGVTVDYVLGQDNDQVITEPDDTEPEAEKATVVSDDTEYGPATILGELDALRETSFIGSQRRAMALVDELNRLLHFLEPDELSQIANNRGLFLDPEDSGSLFSDFFDEDPEEGQKYCGLVEERIADTAILGIDLYTVEMDPLEALADGFGIEAIGNYICNDWNDHSDLVPAIRPQLRAMALTGTLPQFEDQEQFPRRRIEKDE